MTDSCVLHISIFVIEFNMEMRFSDETEIKTEIIPNLAVLIRLNVHTDIRVLCRSQRLLYPRGKNENSSRAYHRTHISKHIAYLSYASCYVRGDGSIQNMHSCRAHTFKELYIWVCSPLYNIDICWYHAADINIHYLVEPQLIINYASHYIGIGLFSCIARAGLVYDEHVTKESIFLHEGRLAY